ncbi:MAG: tRNA-(ms[2]io[6]A)-hydroxylase [Myxococcota bacterium]
MLHLAQPTDDNWFDRIEPHLDVILVDHTHLEKRAASTALSLIFKYTGRDGLPAVLSEIVQEEMEHFSQMLQVLDNQNVEFRRIEPAPYAKSLVGQIRSNEPERLLDTLLVAGLIEARSSERFKILAERVDDSDLADYYAQLFESEARHYTIYTDLARRYYDRDEVAARLDELAELEVEALKAAGDTPRLHSW